MSGLEQVRWFHWEMDDILFDSVAASKIDFYATNSSGEVSVLLLNDVTGNAYTYGLLKTGQEKVPASGNGDSESYKHHCRSGESTL